ncbi:secreted protein [Nannochloropsis gaditana]|uniref:Secreted protein n=1 Tax=Nannochloropsis gaditana TaxID=72520 RepID=W7TK93_9STRA|nr:secreted protein [Nannochloropsis gaditana]
MTVGSTTLTSAGSEDIFMIKLDPNGSPVWAQSFGGTDADEGYGIAVDASGSSYTTGYFEGTMTVGSTTLTSNGLTDIFMIKLDLDGNPVWAQSFGGIASNEGYDIAVDASGSSYTTGYFQGTMTVGNTTLTAVGSSGIYMIKLNLDGNPVWAQSFGGNADDEGKGIAVDASGSSYTTGYFAETMTVGSTNLTAVGDFDIFMIKLDP